MSICFNSITITAPANTTESILRKGFSLSEVDDWGVSPQSFSFAPFVNAHPPESNSENELADIWTNWIELQDTATGEQLTIEFESRETPPLSAVNALTLWLKQENLPFNLEMKYRLENESWEGEFRDEY